MNRIGIKNLILLVFSLMALTSRPQLSHYWNFNFNDESTMLAGAVVGGGAGVSSIYYNPANISESKSSNFTINAGLMQLDIFKLKNPLVSGEHIKKMILTIQPRFISFVLQPKNHPNFIFGIASMNKSKMRLDLNQNHMEILDLLYHSDGSDRYFATYNHSIEYNDQLVGIGGSYRLNDNLSFGLSMFFQFNALSYHYNLDIEAYPLRQEDPLAFYVANYSQEELLQYNTYVLYWQAGAMWRSDKIGLGFTIKSPHLQLWTDGKKNQFKEQQANITDPSTGDPVPDYIISDSQLGGQLDIKPKYPFSVAAGLTLRHPGKALEYYATIEFFGKVKPYLLIDADPAPNMIGGQYESELGGKEFISYASGASPVFNVAFGYRWKTSEKLEILGGLRSDFDYQNNLDYGEYEVYNKVMQFRSNIYHLTSGAKFYIQKNYLMAGFQWSISIEKDMQRIANLENPVEYAPGQPPLQGPPVYDMAFIQNGLSFFFGATFSFGKAK